MRKLMLLGHLLECFFLVAKEIIKGRTWNLIIVDIGIPNGRKRYVYNRTMYGVSFESRDILR